MLRRTYALMAEVCLQALLARQPEESSLPMIKKYLGQLLSPQRLTFRTPILWHAWTLPRADRDSIHRILIDVLTSDETLIKVPLDPPPEINKKSNSAHHHFPR